MRVALAPEPENFPPMVPMVVVVGMVLPGSTIHPTLPLAAPMDRPLFPTSMVDPVVVVQLETVEVPGVEPSPLKRMVTVH